jgi:hypothetical protein
LFKDNPLFATSNQKHISARALRYPLCQQRQNSQLQSLIKDCIMAPATLLEEFNVATDGRSEFANVPRQVKSSKSPLPEVQELDSSTATVEDVVNALKITGGVIVRNFLDMEEIDRIMKDVNPYLLSDKPWDGKHNSSDALWYFLTSVLQEISSLQRLDEPLA